IEKAIAEGHFAFFFDGFDEVNANQREQIGQQIQDMSDIHKSNNYFISSRPDREFEGWQRFSVFETLPLTLSQACRLIEMLPYDKEIKQTFLTDIRNRLFSAHRSFLSNPLLLTIMLLTYSQSADIPQKLNVFYNQAYEALFQRHDALKAGYKRQQHSGLDIQDFAKVFSAFSVLTYGKDQIQFSETEALETLSTAKKLLNINYEEEDFLKDALQSVCLLVEDGLFLTYTHRSFQEYFVARFIRDAEPTIQKKLINKCVKLRSRDYVINLLHEMNPYLIEKVYILPGLNKLYKEIGVNKKLGITHYTQFLKILLKSITLRNGYFHSATGSDPNNLQYYDVLHFTLEKYGRNISWSLEEHEREDKVIIDQSLKERRVILVASLNHRSTYLKNFSKYRSPFSFESLSSGFKIRNWLLSAHKKRESSINDILLT
ncbi:MAG: NACHT domain-containing protein, partial [Promethearchaeota archaeon]